MKNPKIIFFDIDNTIYRKYTDTLRPSVGEALAALKQRSILTAIATGRPPVAIPAKVKALIQEAGIDMLVTINGQYIEFQGKTLQHYPMETDKAAAVCDFLAQQNIAYAFVNHAEIAVSEETAWVKDALSRIVSSYQVDAYYYLQHPVYQLLAFYKQEKDTEIDAAVAQMGAKTARWHENAVDILCQEGSKARGIEHAIAKLGIDMKNVMAFGDSFNDVEMMQAVGFGVAMGNGEEAVKALADYVCPSVDEDGVLRALQDLGVI
ncbi:Cof-type HAD-IIB family hydrolase [Neisseria iguanae]|uniref:Cof-type HAD-IIB family hydrolase n=1 Tax=Neisseria iguanae TaxID=90242 RepID=A0A2P7U190_9NEIS|nr:Cof-type HAD-IIB family hydrolase [Neisseria iguanae]PSJ80705.1 Cof-type HAD-IIB family hydrolase [Neisseria iguanae]